MARVKIKTCALITLAVSIGIAFIDHVLLTSKGNSPSPSVTNGNSGATSNKSPAEQAAGVKDKQIDLPILLWWIPMGSSTGIPRPDRILTCGDVSCYSSNRRELRDHPNTKMILFYGSRLKLHDLPLPRRATEQWALIHEESPKNNWAFCSDRFMRLFNHSATFRATSDYPITLQWLTSIEDIESKRHYRPVEEKNRLAREEDLAPIAYVQGDCGAPSDRDTLVQLMSKYIKIDCLGKCLHNKDLPKNLTNSMRHMGQSDFYDLLSKYKFVMAAENAVCEDYITEKLWRSFYAGTVPIVYGSPTIKNWLPTDKSALVVTDYENVKDLVDDIIALNSNDTAYSEYLTYKTSGVTNQRLLEAMKAREWWLGGGRSYWYTHSCHLCRRICRPRETPDSRREPHPSLGCPRPVPFNRKTESLSALEPDDSVVWGRAYDRELFKGDIVFDLISQNVSSISKSFLDDAVKNRRHGKG